MMSKAVIIERCGGPEVMQLREQTVPPPGPAEVRIQQHVIGLNFIDVYFRTGLYPQALPAGLGVEAAGVVDAVGSAVTYCKPGDRVVYAGGVPGAYAQVRNVAEKLVFKLPASISYETAAAVMLKGLTVEYLFHRTYKLQAGQTVLFHAAAGGVGLLACQWAKALGVDMIGTVGSEDKAKLATQHGCNHVVNYKTENFVERVREITKGKGVDVVYDSIGKDTWPYSLDCLKPRGLMVSFGNSSGVVPDFSPLELSKRGSLFFTRPTLAAYTTKREELLEMCENLFNMVATGKLHPFIGNRYSLLEINKAHRELESRNSLGSSLLYPNLISE